MNNYKYNIFVKRDVKNIANYILSVFFIVHQTNV